MSRFDIVLDGHPLQLYRPGNGRGRSIKETSVPALVSETLELADIPVTLDTFHLGAFYSQRLIPGTYAYALNADCRFPRLVLPGPKVNSVTLASANGHPRAALDFNSHLYVAAGRYVYQINSGTGTVTTTRDLGSGKIGYSMRAFKDKLYVGVGTNATTPSLVNKLDGGSWSEVTGVNGQHLETVWWDTDYRLTANDTANTIKHVAADPGTSGDWSSAITIGESTYPITRLVAAADHLYIAKRDGLYDLDGHSGRAPNLTQQLSHAIDNENGVAAHAASGDVFMSHRKGFLRVRTTGLDYGQTIVVQPGFGLPNETPIRGMVTASVQDGGWTVVAVYNGIDTYICYGRDRQGSEPSAGPSPMLWHGGLIHLPNLQCYLLHISPLPMPSDAARLWIGVGNDTTAQYNLRWVRLPRTEHPLQDFHHYQFAESYSLYVPGQDWGRVATRKNLLQIDVEGDNLGYGVNLAIYTNTEDSAYEFFGNANRAPHSEVFPTTEVIGRRIGLRLDGTGTVTSGANIRGLMLRAAARVKTRSIRQYQIKLAEGQADNLRGIDNRDPYTTWKLLQALEVDQQVTLRDEFGQTVTCLVQAPVTREEFEQQGVDGKTKTLVQVVTLTLEVLNITVSGRGAYWGSGARYGDGYVYGGTVA